MGPATKATKKRENPIKVTVKDGTAATLGDLEQARETGRFNGQGIRGKEQRQMGRVRRLGIKFFQYSERTALSYRRNSKVV